MIEDAQHCEVFKVRGEAAFEHERTAKRSNCQDGRYLRVYTRRVNCSRERIRRCEIVVSRFVFSTSDPTPTHPKWQPARHTNKCSTSSLLETITLHTRKRARQRPDYSLHLVVPHLPPHRLRLSLTTRKHKKLHRDYGTPRGDYSSRDKSEVELISPSC